MTRLCITGLSEFLHHVIIEPVVTPTQGGFMMRNRETIPFPADHNNPNSKKRFAVDRPK